MMKVQLKNILLGTILLLVLGLHQAMAQITGVGPGPNPVSSSIRYRVAYSTRITSSCTTTPQLYLRFKNNISNQNFNATYTANDRPIGVRILVPIAQSGTPGGFRECIINKDFSGCRNLRIKTLDDCPNTCNTAEYDIKLLPVPNSVDFSIATSTLGSRFCIGETITLNTNTGCSSTTIEWEASLSPTGFYRKVKEANSSTTTITYAELNSALGRTITGNDKIYLRYRYKPTTVSGAAQHVSPSKLGYSQSKDFQFEHVPTIVNKSSDDTYCGSDNVTLEACKVNSLGSITWEVSVNGGKFVKLRDTSSETLNFTFQDVKNVISSVKFEDNIALRFRYKNNTTIPVSNLTRHPIKFLPASPSDITYQMVPPQCANSSFGQIRITGHKGSASTNTDAYIYNIREVSPVTGYVDNEIGNAKDHGDVVFDRVQVGKTYEISVKNNSNGGEAEGCTISELKLVTIGNPPPPLAFVYDDPTCTNCSDITNSTNTFTTKCVGGLARLQFALNGGTQDYKYRSYLEGNAPPSFTSFSRSGLAVSFIANTTKYVVEFTDKHNCDVIRYTFRVKNPVQLAADVTPRAATCHGKADGSISVKPTEGEGDFTIKLFKVNATITVIKKKNETHTFSGLSKNTYKVTITDGNGCTRDYTDIEVTQPDALTATVQSKTKVSCPGGSDGTATFKITGGTAAYSIRKGTSGNFIPGNKVDNLMVGTNTVQIRDSKLCILTTTVTIEQVPALTATVQSKTKVSCPGRSDGTATFKITGGTAGYSIRKGTSGSFLPGNKVDNLKKGANTVQIRDSKLCILTTTVTIEEVPALTATVQSKTKVSCPGGSDGTATFNITGGTAGYSIRKGTSGNFIPGNKVGSLKKGANTVQIRDSKLCILTTTVTIEQVPALNISIQSQENVSCNGRSDGMVTFNITGGTPGYSVRKRPSDNYIPGNKLTGLSVGKYNVQVKDSKGCERSIFVDITEPEVLTASVNSKTNVSCNGQSNGTVTFAVSGGTAGYSVRKKAGDKYIPGVQLTGLSAGDYTAQVKDSEDCVVSVSFKITQPKVLTVSVASKKNVSCHGQSNGTVTFAVSGGTAGYSVRKSASSSYVAGRTLTGLSAGDYTAQVKDANNCVRSVSFKIAQPKVLTASVASKKNVSCHGQSNGTVTFAVSGGTAGYSVRKNASSNYVAGRTLTGLSAGDYTAQVKDANNCVRSVSFKITQPKVLTASVASKKNVSCHGQSNGTVTFAVSGGTAGYSVRKSASSNYVAGRTLTGLSAGDYTAQVKDANNCVRSVSFKITQPKALTASVASKKNVSCHGQSNGTVTFAVSGGTAGYSVRKNASSNYVAGRTLTGLSAGDYTAQVKDANNCVRSVSFKITQPKVLTASVASKKNVSCHGQSNGTVTFAVSGGTVGYSVRKNASSNYVAGRTLTGLSAGDYTAQVKDANNCVRSVSFTITQPAVLTATLRSKTPVSCFGGSNGTATYNILGGNGNYRIRKVGQSFVAGKKVSGLTSGNNTIEIEDSEGCKITRTVNITQPARLNLTEVSRKERFCDTPEATVKASGGNGGYSYVWRNSGGTQIGTGTKQTNLTRRVTYRVTVTDSKGCTDQITIRLKDRIVPTLSVVTSKNKVASCSGVADGGATITVPQGVYPVTVTWDNGQTGTATNSTTQVSATGLAAGTRNVILKDAEGCSITRTVNVGTAPAIKFNRSIFNPYCLGGNGSITVSVINGTSPYTYVWRNATTNAVIAGSTTQKLIAKAGQYKVTVTDANGCTKTSGAYTISNPSANLAINQVSVKNITCNGGSNGEIRVAVSGGWGAPYTYSLDNVQYNPVTNPTFTLKGFAAGTHTVYVKDARNGCVRQRKFTLTQPSVVVPGIVSKTNVSCFGDNSGSVTLKATGGPTAGNYTYSRQANSGYRTNPTFNSLTAGNYTFYVRKNGTCRQAINVTISQPAALIVTSSVTPVNCHGGNDGSIRVNISKGTAPYTVSINGQPFRSTTTFNTLKAGTYNFVVKDSKGCLKNLSGVQVTQPTPLALAITQQTIGACATSPNTVRVAATGGRTPYKRISWFNSRGVKIVHNATRRDNLSPGTYQVIVYDAANCTDTLDVDITPDPSLLPDMEIVSTAPTSCDDVADGKATIKITKGATPVTAIWDNGETGLSANRLAKGLRTVTLTDANGCSIEKKVLIRALPAMIILAKSKSNPLCLGSKTGSIEVRVNNGIAPFTYLWSDGQTTKKATNLEAGAHTVIVTDDAGCTQQETFILEDPTSALTLRLASKVIDVSCNGGNDGIAYITAQGGWGGPYQYSTDNVNFVSTSAPVYEIPRLSAGTHTFYVKDDRGCVVSLKVPVLEPKAIVPMIAAQVNVNCKGETNGSVTLTAKGGTGKFTYSKQPNTGFVSDSTFRNLGKGTYTFYVRSDNKCPTSIEVTITEPNQLIATENTALTQGLSCVGANDGQVTLNIRGGTKPYKIAANGGRFVAGKTIGKLQAGSNSLRVEDANGCFTLLTVDIPAPAPIIISLDGQNDSQCGQATGNATISIRGGTGAYTIEWRNKAKQLVGTGTSLSNRAADTYTVNVTDGKGCTASREVIINETGGATMRVISKTKASCAAVADGTATIEITSGVAPVQVRWDNGQTTLAVTQLAAGKRTVTLTDANGCVTVGEVIIEEKPVMTFGKSVLRDPTCQGACNGSIEVRVTNGVAPFTYIWNSGQTRRTRTNLCEGDYTVTVRDANGCEQTHTFSLTAPPALQVVTQNIQLPACVGAADGQIEVITTGGTAPYTYRWLHDATQTNALLSRVGASTYTVRVTDKNNCTIDHTVVLNDPIPITASVVKTKPTCNGDSDGQLVVTAAGGAGGYTYQWSSASTPNLGTNRVLANITAGVYTVNITDANSCSQSFTFNLDEPTSLEIKSFQEPTCPGGNDGSLEVEAKGGTPPYVYNWENGQVGPKATGLSAGTHRVTVSDDKGCVTTFEVNLGEPGTLELTLVAKTETACVTAKGSAEVLATGGTSGYTYIWRNTSGQFIASGAKVTNLDHGDYIVIVEDANRCSTTLNVAINTLPLPDINVVNVTEASCAAVGDGAATIAIAQGQAPIRIVWDNDPTKTGTRQTNLSAGKHTLTLTDKNGCVATRELTIPAKPEMTLGTSIQQNPLCFGGKDGSIQVNIDNGEAPYKYAWSNGATTSAVNGLIAGNYTVTITDANGCTKDTTFVLRAPNRLTIAVQQNQSPQCFGGNDGQLEVKVTGGTAPYTYEWSHQASLNGPLAQNLTAGNYQVTVTDANGCKLSRYSITLNQPQQLSASFTPTLPSCKGNTNGRVRVNPNGGAAGYTYRWSSTSNPNLGKNRTLTGVGAGRYTVQVTDANGCTRSFAYTLAEPLELTLSETDHQDLNCAGDNNGLLKVQALGGNGGYRYTWSNGQTGAQATNLAAGSYTVTVEDRKGCTQRLTLTISQPSPLVITTLQKDETACVAAKGVIEVVASGGNGDYAYTWRNAAGNIIGGQPKLSNLDIGTYTVEVSDRLGCKATKVIELQRIALPSFTITNLTPASCQAVADGAVTVKLLAGKTPVKLRWDNGQTGLTAIGLSAGAHTVILTDANQCDTTITVDIPTIPPMEITLLSSKDPACFGYNDGALRVKVDKGAGNYTYQWSNGATTSTLNGLKAGTYRLTVTDASGCIAEANYTLRDPLQIEAVVKQNQAPSCAGGCNGVLEVEGTKGQGAYTYRWQHNSSLRTNKLENICAGIYTVTITDQAGCSRDTSIMVSDPVPLAIRSQISEIKCFGDNSGHIRVTVSGGTGNSTYRYQWSSATNTNLGNSRALSGLRAGTYQLTVRDANNCSITQSFVLKNPDKLGVALVTAQSRDPLCMGSNDGILQVSATGGTGAYTYRWSNGQTTARATNLRAGTYEITVSDANNCSITQSFVLNDPPKLALALVASQSRDPLCAGSSDGILQVQVTGGTGNYTYRWDNGQTTAQATGLSAGTYEVTVSDAHNCSVTRSFVLNDPPKLAVALVDAQSRDPLCTGSSDGVLQVQATGGTGNYTYRWNNGQTTAQATNLSAGTYEVTVSDAHNCSITRSFVLNDPAKLKVSLVASQSRDPLCVGSSDGVLQVKAMGGSGGYTYRWSNGQTTARATNLEAGIYELTVWDAHNCSVTQSFVLNDPTKLGVTLSAAGSQDPLCVGSADGKLQVKATGGTGRYTYRWSNGQTTALATGLKAGKHSVTVTDANQCTVVAEFELFDPPLFTVNLPTTIDICPGQVYAADPGDIGFVYEWTYNGQFFSSNQVAQVSEAGTYRLKVINANGCVATSQFELNVSASALSAEFAMADAAVIGDTVSALDLSFPEPERIEWTVSGTQNERTLLTTGAYYEKQIIFHKAGTYKVTMHAFNATCQDSVSYTIDILETEQEAQGGDLNQQNQHSSIQEAKVYPNPTRGKFKLFVKLNKPGEVQATVIDPQNLNQVAVKTGQGESEYEFEFDLSKRVYGTYLVTITTGDGAKTLKVVFY